ncbi:MAG TPA: Ran-binding zinc finger domain-containing protein [Gemmatimonadales bacterium]
MVKRGSKSDNTIQALLEERRKIEQWLQRLEMAADQTAAGVRDRVKGDYQARLEEVVSRLQGFGDDLRASLETLQQTRADHKKREKAASEELAEAELRHAVGEFDEADWRERKAGILEVLVQVREGLGDVEEEITELENVLSELDAPAPIVEAPVPSRPAPPPEAPPAPPRSAAASAPAAEPRLSLGSELGLRDLGLGPDAAEEPAAAKTEPDGEDIGDELAFLKSVTEDRGHGPDAARASGAMRAISDEDLPSAAAAGRDLGVDGVEVLADKQSVGESRPSTSNQRTLKCGECGAMNFPTEWYCDRCGAELASL